MMRLLGILLLLAPASVNGQQLLDRIVARHPDNEALISRHQGLRYSYAALQAEELERGEEEDHDGRRDIGGPAAGGLP